MAVTKTDTKPVETKQADPPAAPNETPAPPAAAPERPRVASDCVVDSDMHVGRAVNGKVCSYHAMHYDAAGKRRK